MIPSCTHWVCFGAACLAGAYALQVLVTLELFVLLVHTRFRLTAVGYMPDASVHCQ